MTKTEIINVALSRLGESAVSDIDDGSVAANAAKVIYDTARRTVLRDFPWSFAIREAELPKYAECDSSFFSSAFELPSDCLNVVVSDGANYELANGRLYTNEDRICIRYVADVDDTGSFSPQFIEAFAYKLASELALPIKGSAELMASYNNAYTTLARNGGAQTAQEDRHRLPDNPYYDARFS